MNTLADKFASQFARLRPFGKRDDDPLTSMKTVLRWVDNLPIGDAYKCQQAVLHELKRFNENSTQYTKDRLAVLMLLDEKSHDLQDTLVRQYLRNPRMSRQVESQLWHSVYGLYWEVARGYHAFVLHFARAAGKSPHESQIPLITLRAIRTFGQLLKWRAIRYLPAGEKLWLRLHNLYRVAESEGFHRQPLRAYPEDASECSCETAYLHILMLNLANSGTLYPKQLDLLDNWLQNWHQPLHLDTHVDTNLHNFVVDLSSDHGPRRVRKPDANKPLRFWATADLLLKLNELHAALREGSTPAQLGLTESARTAESLEMLDHLQRHWSSLAGREQRRAPRESIKRLADVTHGLGAIVNLLKGPSAPAAVSPYGTGLNYSEEDDVQVYGFITDRTRERVSQMRAPASLPQQLEHERWVMIDESDCGYGAIVESRDKDWLRVGALVSVKPHESSVWKLGVVRRLSRLDDDSSSVGVETLAEIPELVMLHDASTPGYTVNGYDNSGASQPHPSLWLAGKDGPDSVIIDPVNFMPGKVFQIDGVPDRDQIALGNPIERSEGWIRVAAEPVKR
jgi:cyclic-di-GMP-binding protein